MDLAAIAEGIRAGLAQRYPARMVTRSLKPVDARRDAELSAGVLTVLTFSADGLESAPGMGAIGGAAQFLLTGQVFAGREAEGEDVENVEIALFRDIYDFAQAPGAGLCPLELNTVQFSGQQIVPYGWVRCEMTYAELD